MFAQDCNENTKLVPKMLTSTLKWTLLMAALCVLVNGPHGARAFLGNRTEVQVRHRRQTPGQCFTLEGIPGKCSTPEACRFPAAVKVRLSRSQCFTVSGQRGICCPGGTAAAATAAFSNPTVRFPPQPQSEQLRQLPPQRRPFNQQFFPAVSPRPTFRPNDNGPLLFEPTVDSEPNLSDLPLEDLHTACDDSVNCLLTTDGPEQGEFLEGLPVRHRVINSQRVILTPRPFNQPSRNFPNNKNNNNNINFNTGSGGNNINQQPTFVTQPPFLDNPPSQQQQAIDPISVTSQPRTQDCPATPVCFNSKYRTFDGSCNNLNNPNWGKSFFAFPRLLPPQYADGISAPRRATDGSELPSARLVSNTLVKDANFPDNFNTAMIMAYGQFLDHDLTRTAITKGANNTPIACCRRAMIENPSLRHEACLQIEIPLSDPFYAPFNQTCMEFVRSLAAPRPDCRFGPREQMNQITSHMDASNIYGSTKEDSEDLRTRQGGRLQVSRVNDGDLLPFVTTKPDFCSKPDQGLFCFKAGDTRVNEQLSLTVVHTIWLREHNRIAGELARINPHWSDQNIYMETRRIIGAMLQHITYNEFLPVLLGRTAMQTSDLLLLRSGYSFDYDPNINPSVTNEFATAAYRFGHTLIPGNFLRFDPLGQQEEIPLRQQFNKPFHLYDAGGLDGFLRGLSTQRSQQFDRFITEEVTNHLFERSRPFGLDLVAINLQRGRDHGLPGYNEWRQFCGFRRINSFQELSREMNPQYVQTLQQLYRTVDDIDLFVAGIAETALRGAKLGATFGCIIADQFKRLKKGDRFWYENGFNSPFTPEQLQEIRKVTFARLICDNGDNIQQIQQFVFFAPARGNSLMPCRGDSIPHMDLTQWTNEPIE